MGGDVEKQRVALHGKRSITVEDPLEKVPAEQGTAEVLLGVGMLGRHKFQPTVEIAEARRALRKAGDLFVDRRRQGKPGKQAVRAERAHRRITIDAGEHRFLGFLRRSNRFCATPMQPPRRHGACQHEHRQPCRILAKVRQISRNPHGNAAQQAAVSSD